MARRTKDPDALKSYHQDHAYCEVCGDPVFQVHHIVYRSQLGPDAAWNFIALCEKCHAAAHGVAAHQLRLGFLIDKMMGGESLPSEWVKKIFGGLNISEV